MAEQPPNSLQQELNHRLQRIIQRLRAVSPSSETPEEKGFGTPTAASSTPQPTHQPNSAAFVRPNANVQQDSSAATPRKSLRGNTPTAIAAPVGALAAASGTAPTATGQPPSPAARSWGQMLWNSFKTFAILFSFLVNFILLLALLYLGQRFLELQQTQLQPAIQSSLGTFYKSFNDMENATISRTIAINDSLPVQFDLPIQQNTNVILTAPVALDNLPVTVTLLGGAGQINGYVDLTLPTGTVLPVQLNLNIPINQQVPVNLNVPVNIPLRETSLGSSFADLKGIINFYDQQLGAVPGYKSILPVDGVQPTP